MKKLTVILFIAITFLVGFKVVINRYYYKDEFLWPSVSYEEAIENNAIVARYEIKEIDTEVVDSLRMYNYYQKTIKNKYWIEKQSREFPKYLFFRERVYSKDNFIRYDDLIFSSCEDWRDWLSDSLKAPMVILSLDDSSRINNIRREKHYYESLNTATLPYQITLYVYFNRPKDNSHQSYLKNVSDIANDHLTTEYLGKIILAESDSLNFEKGSSQSFWRTFNLIPKRRKKKSPCYIGDLVKDEDGKIVNN